MSKNSKNTSKTKVDKKHLERPFAASVLRSAGKTAKQYHIILERHHELGFTASCVEFPTVFADGQTPDKCVKAIQKALTAAVATMIESGKEPPKPFSAKKRDVQVNVRLTYAEKMALAQASKNHGFKGLSDFIRTSVLDHIHCIS